MSLQTSFTKERPLIPFYASSWNKHLRDAACAPLQNQRRRAPTTAPVTKAALYASARRLNTSETARAVNILTHVESV
ncbi:MAG TPA: hypothetical protein VEQ40_13690 [Pyrinomonadaceae bacterium]|nr:hypothetical protein [Pyrinomonadaceae bacterium]